MRQKTLVRCIKVPVSRLPSRDSRASFVTAMTCRVSKHLHRRRPRTHTHTHIVQDRLHIAEESLLSRFVRVHACRQLNPPLSWRGNRIISGCTVRSADCPSHSQAENRRKRRVYQLRPIWFPWLGQFSTIILPLRSFIHIYLLIGG